MLHGLIGVVRRLKVDVRVSPRELRVVAVRRHFDRLDRSVDGEDLDDVFTVHIPRQVSNVHLGRLRSWTALAPRWCRLSTRRPRAWRSRPATTHPLIMITHPGSWVGPETGKASDQHHRRPRAHSSSCQWLFKRGTNALLFQNTFTAGEPVVQIQLLIISINV